jgi:putative hydrolase of the HAD superfamily
VIREGVLVKERLQEIRGVIWDWGDTLMRDLPGQEGPMVDWPRVEAMPGAGEALAALGALPTVGVQCVATNAQDSSSAAVAQALARVGLNASLDRFFTSGELGVAKPDPAFFEAVAGELALDPCHLLSIGNDLSKDIEPAKAAGMATILIAPKSDSHFLRVADLVIQDLAHLPELLRGPGP